MGSFSRTANAWFAPIAATCLAFVALTWTIPVFAQECSELEGDDLTVCLTLMVCMALEEDKARNQCLEVARQVLDQHDAQKESTETEEPAQEELTQQETEPSIVEESPPLVEESFEAQTVEEEVTEPPVEVTQSVESSSNEQTEESRPRGLRRAFGWLRRGGDKRDEPEEAIEEFTVDGVPTQFAATVVAVTNSGYNDALLVLSNRYVFMVTRVRQSRIEPGDVIVGRKKEGLSGRYTYLFYGRGASVDARRVDCSHVDPSRQTKERCEYAARHLGTSAL